MLALLAVLSLLEQTATLTGFRVYVDNVRLTVPLDATARAAPLPVKPAGTYLVDVSATWSDGSEGARTGAFWVVTAATAALPWRVLWDWDPTSKTIRPAGKPSIVNTVAPPTTSCPTITPGSGSIAGPGGTWTLGTDRRTLLNGAWMGNGLGVQMKLTPTNEVQVLGGDTNWYRWTAPSWVRTNAGPPC